MIDYIFNEVFNNPFYKLCIGIIIALVLTFAHDIHILKEWWVLFLVAFITLLLLSLNILDDLGIILLMIALLIITYNQNINRINKKKEGY
jgi:uncharacterized membrane protein YhaH (DUF805 family)